MDLFVMVRPISLCILGFLVACTSPTDPRYKVSTIGNATRSTPAIIVNVEPVVIYRGTSGAGANAGGALAAAAAYENSDNAAVIIAGLIGGAIIGNLVEETGANANGHQYLIETGSGALLAVAQLDQGNLIFQRGENVILIYGNPHRLVADPRKPKGR